MAAALNIEQLKGIVECSICLEPYDNPKILSCTHHFCKSCLDDVVTFTEDGCGVITCPNRCPQKTMLKRDETVNDLLHCYDFKNLMEALNLDSSSGVQSPRCMYDAECTKDIAVYCSGTFMCKACFSKSVDTLLAAVQPKKDLIFSKKSNKMYVLCTKHVCPCIFLCMDNTFLCRYCAHRDEVHKHHKMKLVEEEILAIKSALNNSSISRSEHCSLVKTETLAIINKGRENLDAVLKARKAESLMRYTELLDAEEERLKAEYDLTCGKHLEQYSTEFFSGYNGSNNDGVLDVQFAIEKEEILNEILWSENEMPYLETVILSEEYQSFSENPLGAISSEKKTANADHINSTQNARSTLMLNSVLKEKVCKGAGSGASVASRKLATDDRPVENSDTMTSSRSHVPDTEQDALRLSCDYVMNIMSKMSVNEGNTASSAADSSHAGYSGVNPMDFTEHSDGSFQERDYSDSLSESMTAGASDWLASIFDASKSISRSTSAEEPMQRHINENTLIELPAPALSEIQLPAPALSEIQLASPALAEIENDAPAKCKNKKKKKKKKKTANILLNPAWKINQTWLEISVNKVRIDRIVVDLFNEDAPNTCSTFVQYLTATGDCPFKYKGSRMRTEIDAIILDPERTSEYLAKHIPLGKNKFEDSHDHDHIHNIFSLIMKMDSDLGVFAILTDSETADSAVVEGQHVVFGEVTYETVPAFVNILSYTETKSKASIVIVIDNCGLV